MGVRNIIFKAKRIDNGEWVKGGYVNKTDYYGIECDNHYIIDGTQTDTEGYGEHYLVDKDTICQYTGLTDKNGNKIWENDVVKCNYNDYGEKGTYIGKVIFREDTCTFIVTDGKSTDYEWWNEEKEVIGNIFDNAELLKGE